MIFKCPEVLIIDSQGRDVFVPCCDTGMRSSGQLHDPDCRLSIHLRYPLSDPKLGNLAELVAAARALRVTPKDIVLVAHLCEALARLEKASLDRFAETKIKETTSKPAPREAVSEQKPDMPAELL